MQLTGFQVVLTVHTQHLTLSGSLLPMLRCDTRKTSASDVMVLVGIESLYYNIIGTQLVKH